MRVKQPRKVRKLQLEPRRVRKLQPRRVSTEWCPEHNVLVIYASSLMF
jgi:hypothetical protein